MRRLLHALIVLTGLALADRAGAATPVMPAAPAPGAQTTLFVELLVNGRVGGELAPLRTDGKALWVDRDALRQAGLIIEGAGEIDLSNAPGLTAHFDAAMQRLEIKASVELLPVNHVASKGMERVAPTSSTGALLNYDVYVLDGASRMASLWTEQRVFGPLGLISNNGVLTKTDDPAGRQGYRRYDTYARFIDEDRAVAVTAGDLISQSLPWSRSVRIGGLQVSRAFRVRPDLVTMPLPSFAGEAAVPTSVDLFVNGFRQQTADVAPGRFVLDSVPVVNGAGQATIVTVDALGREVQTTLPFYVSADLLKPGLSDFSFEAGQLRRNYGLANFDYGPAVASATVRHGVSDSLTVEAHGELAADLTGVGLGMVWAPGEIGTVAASLSGSDAKGMRGNRWSLAYEYTASGFNFAYQHEQQSSGFRDLGSLDGTWRPAYTSDRFVGGVSLRGAGSLSLAYIAAKTEGRPQTRILTASYFRTLGENATLLVTADRDFETGANGGQVRLTVPFGSSTLGASTTRTNGQTLAAVDYSRSIPTQGGFGVDVGVATDRQRRAYGQGSVNYRVSGIQLQAGAAYAARARSAWGSAAGSLIFVDDDVFVANQSSDAFAVVSTGMASVPVLYENQPVGKTDVNGRLFVPNVASYQPATFSIDALSLSEGYVAASVSAQVAVREGSGAVVRLPVREARSVMVVLVDAEGRNLEPGGGAQRSDGGRAEVGWDGLVYLEDVPSAVDLTVAQRDGKSCRARVSVPPGMASLSKIGPVSCI